MIHAHVGAVRNTRSVVENKILVATLFGFGLRVQTENRRQTSSPFSNLYWAALFLLNNNLQI
jgi:hypothetical protein